MVHGKHRDDLLGREAEGHAVARRQPVRVVSADIDDRPALDPSSCVADYHGDDSHAYLGNSMTATPSGVAEFAAK